MAAKVCERTPFPERVGEVAGKITADAQQGRLAPAPVHAAIGAGVSTEWRARILHLAEVALGRAAKDLAVARYALGGAPGQDPRLRAGEACDAMEQCCDRLLLVDLLLNDNEGNARVPVPGADDNEGNARVRAADALGKAMEMAEDCASLVRRARQDAFGTPAT